MAAFDDLVVVIMAGGAGTRFWPASTSTRPKQLLALTSERTLLQLSFDRVAPMVPPERVFIVTGEAFAHEVVKQLPEVPRKNILAEPMRRDTAAAIAWASYEVERAFPGAVMAVLTSDHIIEPQAAFGAALARAAAGARESGALYTFGIPPTFAATGFGYLELAGFSEDEALVRFVEKPQRARAEEFLKSGRFLWNAGMFVWRTSSILAELAAHLPMHAEHLQAAVQGKMRLADAFERLPRISIDFGVMEKAKNVRCVRAPFRWSDVGSFPALAEHLPKDGSDNAARARLATFDAHRNVVWNTDPSELVALVGVSDLVVVRAGKKTLVVHKDRAEEVKKLVEGLAEADQ